MARDEIPGTMLLAELTAENIKALVAVLAVFVSITSLVISIYVSRRSTVVGRRPVLVFDYDGVIGWRVRNIGVGPALNVIIAQKEVGGGWFNPVRIPPLAKDGDFVLSWCLHVNDTGLGAL